MVNTPGMCLKIKINYLDSLCVSQGKHCSLGQKLYNL